MEGPESTGPKEDNMDHKALIEDFVRTLRDNDPTTTFDTISPDLEDAFRKDRAARNPIPKEKRRTAAKKAAATRKANAAARKESRKTRGPHWPGYFHGAPKPKGWKRSDYTWNDSTGEWIEKKR